MLTIASLAASDGKCDGDHLICELVFGWVAPHNHQLMLYKCFDTAPGAVVFPGHFRSWIY